MHDAPLPGDTRKDLPDGATRPLVHIGDDAEDAGDTALPKRFQKYEPTRMGFRANRASGVGVTNVSQAE